MAGFLCILHPGQSGRRPRCKILQSPFVTDALFRAFSVSRQLLSFLSSLPFFYTLGSLVKGQVPVR